MPPARGGKPDALVVLLHGYGSNGADLDQPRAVLGQGAAGRVFRLAQRDREPVPQTPGGYQWFPISNLDPHLMEAGVRHAGAIGGSVHRP